MQERYGEVCALKGLVTVWTFAEDGEHPGLSGLHAIHEGDHLTVYGENREVLFSGIIDPERSGHIYTHSTSKHIFWWKQRGWEPDNWAELFLHQDLGESGTKPLRAVLIKKADLVTSPTLAFEPVHDTYKRPFEEG